MAGATGWSVPTVVCSGSVMPNFYGSVPGLGLHLDDVVGIAATPDGGGYWLVGADGGVFAFGDAIFHGSLLQQSIVADDVVGMAATPNGSGYWLAGADGGVFSFGSATFLGSMGGQVLAAPVVGIAAHATGRGYWLAGADGGVFAFGDAPFESSCVQIDCGPTTKGEATIPAQVVGMAGTPITSAG